MKSERKREKIESMRQERVVLKKSVEKNKWTDIGKDLGDGMREGLKKNIRCSSYLGLMWEKYEMFVCRWMVSGRGREHQRNFKFNILRYWMYVCVCVCVCVCVSVKRLRVFREALYKIELID